jgi:hypothetical protein
MYGEAHEEEFEGLGFDLSQPARLPGGKQVFVRKVNGVRRLIDFDETRKAFTKGKVWNSYAIGRNNKVCIVENDKIRWPKTPEEKAKAKAYLEMAQKKGGGGKGRRGKGKGGGGGGDNKSTNGDAQSSNGDAQSTTSGKGRKGKGKRKGRRGIAPNPYGVYQIIRANLQSILKIVKDDSKEHPYVDVFGPPVHLGQILEFATEFATELHNRTEFFQGMREGYIMGLPLRYLLDKVIDDTNFGDKGPPEYLVKFDSFWKREGKVNEPAKEKYKIVATFLSKLQASIRKAVNAHANEVSRNNRVSKLTDELAAEFGVSAEGNLRDVREASLEKMLSMSQEELGKLKLGKGSGKVIVLALVMHVQDITGSNKMNWTQFLGHIAGSDDLKKLLPFVESRRVLFQRAIGKAQKIMYNRMKAHEKMHGRSEAGSEAPSRFEEVIEEPTAREFRQKPGENLASRAPGRGLDSLLVSMRYEE